MSVVAFIFARGGSKTVPGKNLRKLRGRPLLAHAIEAARAARSVDRVVVSTDDEEIAAEARRWGADVPFLRPAELATDGSEEWLSWQHALTFLREREGPDAVQVFVSVPTTSPLRAPGDVDACVALLRDSGADLVLTVTPAHRNPYFNMVVFEEDGAVRPVMGDRVEQRQAAPAVYDMTTVAYAARPDYVLSAGRLMEGRVRAVVVPTERALDIDTEQDLAFAEFVLTRGADGGGSP